MHVLTCKNDDRPLIKTGALWFAAILNSLKTNIFAIDQFQTMQNLHLWVKNSEKKNVILLFSKKFLLFIEWHLYR